MLIWKHILLPDLIYFSCNSISQVQTISYFVLSESMYNAFFPRSIYGKNTLRKNRSLQNELYIFSFGIRNRLLLCREFNSSHES